MALVVRLPNGHTLRFTSPFHIGRERGCDVEVADNHVSRRHAEVSLSGRTWVIRDLQSSNGLFVNGKRVDAAPIGHGVQVTLGEDGPTLSIEPEETAQMSSDRETSEDDTLESYAQRYFTSEDDEDESVGGRTLMIRKAFQKVQQQQRRRHRLIIAAVALIAVGAGAYALYVHRALGRQIQQAQEIFYQMKAQDVLFAELEQKLAQSGNAPGQQQFAAYMAERQRMLQDYDGYVANLFDRK